MKYLGVYILLAILGLFLLAFIPFLLLRPLNPILWQSWLLLCFLAGLAMIKDNVLRMKSDVIFLVFFLGDLLGIYSQLKEKDSEGRPGKPGMLDSGLVITFPPGLMVAYSLPTPLVKISLKLMGDYLDYSEEMQKFFEATGDSPEEAANRVGSNPMEIVVILNFQFNLSHDREGLLKFVQALPILQEKNLARKVDMEFYEVIEGSHEIKTYQEETYCLAEVVKKAVISPVDAAMSRCLQDYTLMQALQNLKEISTNLKKELVGTIFETAGIINPDDTGEDEWGEAVRKGEFNIEHIVMQLQGELAGPFLAMYKAKKERLKGIAAKVRRKEEQEAGLSPQEVGALEMASSVDKLTIVSSSPENLLGGFVTSQLGS
jgi:hypothetical protein